MGRLAPLEGMDIPAGPFRYPLPGGSHAFTGRLVSAMLSPADKQKLILNGDRHSILTTPPKMCEEKLPAIMQNSCRHTVQSTEDGPAAYESFLRAGGWRIGCADGMSRDRTMRSSGESPSMTRNPDSCIS